MPVTELETLLACKMMALLPGFTVAERRVGTGIIEHYNRTTGRCDPGVKRLASLFEYDRRTVLRATTALCDSGLFSKRRHGGRLLRNSYEPNWQKFRELHDEWQDRFRGKGGRSLPGPVTQPPPSQGPGGPLTGGSAVPQTCSSNLKKEPDARGHVVGTTAGGTGPGTVSNGQARRDIVRSSHLAPQPPSSREAEETSAERRWNSDLLNLLRDQPRTYELVVDWIDLITREAATESEKKQRGSGVYLVLGEVRKERPDLLERGDRLGATHEGLGSSQGPAPLAVVSDPDGAPVRLAKTRPDDDLTNLTVPDDREENVR